MSEREEKTRAEGQYGCETQCEGRKKLVRFARRRSAGWQRIWCCLAHAADLLQLWSSHIKETNFFTSGYSGGLANYASYFTQKDLYGSPDSRILFEASPAYLSAATARDRMFTLLPDAQLIVSLRDPVTRAYSHWNYFLFQREKCAPAPAASPPPLLTAG